jgi:hypothetical protein
MLRSLGDLENYSVHVTDGDIGKVVNFLLDDKRWVIRYLVVDTGGGRPVSWASDRPELAPEREARRARL